MDIKDIKTVEQAKALAYEQVIAIEQAQTNLRMLQERIVELEQDNTVTKK